MTTNSKRGLAISSSWVLIIVTPLLALVLWIAINYANQQRDHALRDALQRQHHATVAGCLRGNVLRGRVNDAIHVEHDFLITARTARLAAVQAAANNAERQLNRTAANAYTGYLKILHTIPIVDCAKAYPKP